MEWLFRVKRGTATEQERDAALAKLAATDNRDQIKDYLLEQIKVHITFRPIIVRMYQYLKVTKPKVLPRQSI
ncbi:hypothetical protein D3C85_1560330 [compost metagenome]